MPPDIPRRSLHALSSGTVLHDYVIDSELGSGGFSIVYLGRHRLKPGWLFAIKEYFPRELAVRDNDGTSVHAVDTEARNAFEEGLRRFRDEAEQLRKFRNEPYIVSCINYFEWNGTAYLVMDYDDGLPLSEFLEQREVAGQPFTEKDMLAVVEPLLEGLAVVHGAGVLHRDIKPGNIFVRGQDDITGRPAGPVLIDFGAAKQNYLERHSRSRAPYTPGYAAYEQVSSDGDIGPWTDIYAIGALMWRMVVGGCPEDGRLLVPDHVDQTGELGVWSPTPRAAERRAYALHRGQEDTMVSAAKLGAGRFPSDLLQVIDSCLALYPEDRVQSCEQLRSLMEGSEPLKPDGTGTRSVTITTREGARLAVLSRLLPGDRFQDAPDCPEMIVVPAGSYVMGSPHEIWVPSGGAELNDYERLLMLVDGPRPETARNLEYRLKRKVEDLALSQSWTEPNECIATILDDFKTLAKKCTHRVKSYQDSSGCSSRSLSDLGQWWNQLYASVPDYPLEDPHLRLIAATAFQLGKDISNFNALAGLEHRMDYETLETLRFDLVSALASFPQPQIDTGWSTYDGFSGRNESGRQSNEGPIHQVTIAKPFAVGVCPVTRGEFRRFIDATGYSPKGICVVSAPLYERHRYETADGEAPDLEWHNPGFEQTDLHPVVCVSWLDAEAYAEWLSQVTGEPYRLLSESEWEYVARAETTTPFHFGSTISTDLANYNGKSTYHSGSQGRYHEGTTSVATFPANGFGVHDVHGNTWEWTQDGATVSYWGARSDSQPVEYEYCTNFVMRGGSWKDEPRSLRSAMRISYAYGHCSHDIGFRVARNTHP